MKIMSNQRYLCIKWKLCQIIDKKDAFVGESISTYCPVLQTAEFLIHKNIAIEKSIYEFRQLINK